MNAESAFPIDGEKRHEAATACDKAETSTATTATMPREQLIRDTNKFLKEYSEDYRRLAE